jgi:glycine oxidase
MAAGRHFDALILGQGLAGSLLAWTLAGRGWSVCVIDDGHLSASSRAAAGLINPVTGKRLAKAAEVDRLLPQAKRVYRHLEQTLGQRLLHWVPMARLFRSPEEAQIADRRLADPDYQAYLGPRLAPSEVGQRVIAPLGGLLQRRTGFLDSRGLIECLARRLTAEGRVVRHSVGPADIEIHNDRVECLGLSAARLILCQGYQAMQNPLTAWLPFQPAKGEILTLQTSSPLPERILNAGRWLLPIGENRFKLGATYDWAHLDSRPTDKGRRSLLAALDKLIELDHVKVTEHLAGVRPATLDSAPFIGRHPRCPGLWVFNGFGSKGALQIPAYAEILADHLESGRALPVRVDVHRYSARLR